MDKRERIELIEEAKAMGLKSITIEGIVYEFGEPVKGGGYVADTKAEDLIKPLSVFEEMTDEEILYWSTPYGLELEAKRKRMEERKREELGELE